VSDAGAGFSLGESLVEWPMATTAVCKSAQASVRKIACITLLVLCALFVLILPHAAGQNSWLDPLRRGHTSPASAQGCFFKTFPPLPVPFFSPRERDS